MTISLADAFWESDLDLATQCLRHPFVRGLADGSLPQSRYRGYVAQDAFLNAAALLRTTLSSQVLLEELLRIEREQGRVRDLRWGPRTLDLDLITYGDLVLNEPGLPLPHPRRS
jgi:2-amino-4-hydroxy-6-hydroxymethyldihydropteridine diphosphokinase